MLPCNHAYVLEGLAMTFQKVFWLKKIVYLGGWFLHQNSASIKRPEVSPIEVVSQVPPLGFDFKWHVKVVRITSQEV